MQVNYENPVGGEEVKVLLRNTKVYPCKPECMHSTTQKMWAKLKGAKLEVKRPVSVRSLSFNFICETKKAYKIADEKAIAVARKHRNVHNDYYICEHVVLRECK